MTHYQQQQNDSTRGIRNRLFLRVMSGIVPAFVAVDYFNLVDECLVTYGLIVALGLVSLVMGSYWYFIADHASDLFHWLMALLLGVVITNLFNLYARTLYVAGLTTEYDCLVNSGWWRYRSVIQAVALLYIVCLIFVRVRQPRTQES